MSQDKVQPVRNPSRIWSYVSLEWRSLIIITITGILYNAGMSCSMSRMVRSKASRMRRTKPIVRAGAVSASELMAAGFTLI